MPTYECIDSDFLLSDIADCKGRGDIIELNLNKFSHGSKDKVSIKCANLENNSIKNDLYSEKSTKKLHKQILNSPSLDDSLSNKKAEGFDQDDLSICSSIVTSNSIYFDVENSFIASNSKGILSFQKKSDHEDRRAKVESNCDTSGNRFSNIDFNEQSMKKENLVCCDENSCNATMATDFSSFSEQISIQSLTSLTASPMNESNKRRWGGLLSRVKDIAGNFMNGLALEIEASNLENTHNSSCCSINHNKMDSSTQANLENKKRIYHRESNRVFFGPQA